jgi:predicted metal-dependent enzyme (double-stranded beta helix superfamily)
VISTQSPIQVLIRDIRATVQAAPDPAHPPLEPIKAAIERTFADTQFMVDAFGSQQQDDAIGGRLLYEDPDYGFAVWASVEKPGVVRTPHDHGPTWAVYGVYRGRIDTTLYERVDHGTREGYAEVRELRRYVASDGEVSCLPRGIAHRTECVGEKPSLNLIVRGLKWYWKHNYDPTARTVEIATFRVGGPVAPA